MHRRHKLDSAISDDDIVRCSIMCLYFWWISIATIMCIVVLRILQLDDI